MDISKLKSRFSGEIYDDEETLESVSGDFGRLIYRTPAAVVVPTSADDVRTAIEVANRESWTVSMRGASHSQGGQSLNEGGLLLDTLALNRLIKIDQESAWVEAGMLWSDLVKVLAPRGLTPPVLTNNLNLTIGGTISFGGLGVSSHRYGIQADNVEALEVVTGNGDLVYCSAQENEELFNCVRCGIGQFAVITKAQVRLRRFLPFVRTHYLLYDDFDRLMADQERIVLEDRFDYVEGWCRPLTQGMRKLGETKVSFAEWFYPLQLSIEYAEGPPPVESCLYGLKPYRRVHTEDSSFSEFLKRMEPVFLEWRETGGWVLPHPWMEVILPWDRASEYIQGVLKSFPPNLLSGGQVLQWPCRGGFSSLPMFAHPEGDLTMVFGVLPSVQRQQLGMTVSLLNRASDLVKQVDGKRYLSGLIDFDSTRWKEHFGDSWEEIVRWKKFFDPNSILNPGFVKYSDT
jgi:FAD/FMN-containing dehydrogenase